MTDSVLAAIVNFRRTTLTERAVASVLRSTRVPPDVVVVDVGSTARTRSELRRALPSSVAILPLQQNRGYAAAVNAAHELARRLGKSAVWVLNNDIVVEPTCLEALLSARYGSGPLIAGVAAVTVKASDGETVLCGGVDVVVALGRARHRFSGKRVSDLPQRSYDVEAVEASCLLLDVAAFDVIGHFDETFFMYWEDTEWSVRARRAGFRLRVAPAGVARHDVGASTLPLTRVELLIRNRIRFVRRTANRPSQVLFAAYFLGVWVPAYLATKLVPRFGWRASLNLVGRSIQLNVREMMRSGGSGRGHPLPRKTR